MSTFYNSIPNTVKSRTYKVAFAACGCVLLFGVLGLIVAVQVFQSGSKSVEGAEKAADRFLTALEHRDYASAYQQMTHNPQASESADSIRDVMEVLQKRRGPASRHTMQPGFFIDTYNGVTKVRLTYQEEFQNGQTLVQLQLSPEQGQWRVLAFNFNF